MDVVLALRVVVVLVLLVALLVLVLVFFALLLLVVVMVGVLQPALASALVLAGTCAACATGGGQ